MELAIRIDCFRNISGIIIIVGALNSPLSIKIIGLNSTEIN